MGGALARTLVELNTMEDESTEGARISTATKDDVAADVACLVWLVG